MRLLEFNRDEGGANPQQAMRSRSPRKKAVPPVSIPRKAARVTTEAPANPQLGKVFQVKTSAVRKPANRGPIDLEHLQQRIAMLERRIQARTEQAAEHPAIKELEQLKQRMKLLERKLDNELWLASQREQTMLELLSKQPIKAQIKQMLVRFWREHLPAIGRWLQGAALSWWQDNQPRWWPELARAWQESLDKARR